MAPLGSGIAPESGDPDYLLLESADGLLLEASIWSGAATIVGNGTLSPTGLHVAPRAGALAGAGAISSTGVHVAPRVAAVAGAGAISSTGLHVSPRGASIAGAGAISGGGYVVRSGTATVTGSGAISAIGLHVLPRSAAITGIGTVDATGLHVEPGEGAIAGTGTISASGEVPPPVVIPSPWWIRTRPEPAKQHIKVFVSESDHVLLLVITGTPSIKTGSGVRTESRCHARPVNISTRARCHTLRTFAHLNGMQRVMRPEAVRWITKRRRVASAVVCGIEAQEYATQRT